MSDPNDPNDAVTAVAAHLRFQANACKQLGSQLYAALLERIAADVEAGGPSWRALERFATWPRDSAYALRFMGAVHRLVLTDEAPELAPHFGPGADPSRAWNALQELLDEKAEEIGQSAEERPVQTNEVGRCAALAPAMLWIARGRPVRLLELGASAGLNLRWDSYRYEDLWGDPGSPARLVDRYGDMPPPFTPQTIEVVERRGCDPRPIDPSSEEGRTTLLSFVWPDQAERVELLRAALDLAVRVPATIDAAPADEWLEQELAKPLPDNTTTIVFHSIVWQYLDERTRERVASTLREAGAKATADTPLAWLRMEPDGDLTRVDATLWPGGESRMIARAGYHGRPVRWVARDGRGAGGS